MAGWVAVGVLVEVGGEEEEEEEKLVRSRSGS